MAQIRKTRGLGSHHGQCCFILKELCTGFRAIGVKIGALALHMDKMAHKLDKHESHISTAEQRFSILEEDTAPHLEKLSTLESQLAIVSDKNEDLRAPHT